MFCILRMSQYIQYVPMFLTKLLYIAVICCYNTPSFFAFHVTFLPIRIIPWIGTRTILLETFVITQKTMVNLGQYPLEIFKKIRWIMPTKTSCYMVTRAGWNGAAPRRWEFPAARDPQKWSAVKRLHPYTFVEIEAGILPTWIREKTRPCTVI